jgi:mRNA interferase MazF
VQVHRGDIFFANLNPVIGSEQGGLRPVLILQNDIGNTYSPTTIVAALTSRIKRAKLPTHVEVPRGKYSLDKDSVILCEQLRTIDKQRLKERIGSLDEEAMLRVNAALDISLGLKPIE